MKIISSSDEVKQISLDILVNFHKYCGEHALNYSLACGSLIGAVRHKGFIPWDDDVDVYMLREDYDALMAHFPQEYMSNYSLISLERSAQWNYPFAKLYDNRTILQEDVKYRLDDIGIGIDIFPIDNAPNDDETWSSYEKKRKFLRDIFVMKKLKWRKERGLIKNFVVALLSFVLLPVSSRYLACRMDNFAKKYNLADTNYLAENCLGAINNRFFRKDMDDFIDMTFENYNLRVMEGYHDYLTRFYGDYMELPPEKERKSHHAFIAYWK